MHGNNIHTKCNTHRKQRDYIDCVNNLFCVIIEREREREREREMLGTIITIYFGFLLYWCFEFVIF